MAKTLAEVKAEMLARAKKSPIGAFAWKKGKTYTSISSMKTKYVEPCTTELTAKIDSCYVTDGVVADDAPIEVVDGPADFLEGTKNLMAFTTPALKEKSLHVELVERALLGPNTYRFPAGHNFAVETQKIEEELFKSADGRYYLEAALPENDDGFIIERFSAEVKSERNSRIADTDDYVKLSDITVQKAARAKREALTDEERAEVIAYRESLRDLPEMDGFPFVDYPSIPACIQYECEAKAQARESRRAMYEKMGGL